MKRRNKTKNKNSLTKKHHKMAVHFSSAKQDWETPQKLFDELDEKYNFTLDAAASKGNEKCHTFFTPNGMFQNFDDYEQITDQDGLNSRWIDPDYGNSANVYLNPPYGREIGKWVKKAYEESTRCCLVVCLLPARVDTRWFHNFIYNKPGVVVDFLKGRLKFGSATNSAPFPSMIVVFNPTKDIA